MKPRETYYYKVHSNNKNYQPSDVVSITADTSGSIIKSKWCEKKINIDGSIENEEWDGAATYDISGPYNSMSLYWDGTAWSAF